MVDLSVVIPVKNEEDNVKELHSELVDVLSQENLSYEIIFIDDGSTDNTVAGLKSLNNVVIIQLNRNFGQSAAMRAGFDYANGRYIVSMDGDLQNDPYDIPKLLNEIKKGSFDVICGWRFKRKDRFFKRIFSRFANRLRRILTRDIIHDSGCSLRIYTKEAAKNLELQGEMHRYIPALLNWGGYRVGETKVNHRKRMRGQTKYGWKRLIKGFLDLIFVSFWYRFSATPLQFFGLVGILLIVFGGAVSSFLIYGRVFYNEGLSDRPLFTLSLMTVILGVQTFTLGFIAEYLSRIYYQTSLTKPYVIKQVLEIN
ncbi:MAG: glycosyltransferase family 2 protein [Candidatus Hodarchaeota archaeon]